jgi:hypothetical protein
VQHAYSDTSPPRPVQSPVASTSSVMLHPVSGYPSPFPHPMQPAAYGPGQPRSPIPGPGAYAWPAPGSVPLTATGLRRAGPMQFPFTTQPTQVPHPNPNWSAPPAPSWSAAAGSQMGYPPPPPIGLPVSPRLPTAQHPIPPPHPQHNPGHSPQASLSAPQGPPASTQWWTPGTHPPPGRRRRS